MEYICPITQDIMTEPVTDEFGHTYERQAIQRWMNSNNKSPVSGQLYQTKVLVPNYSLKGLIENLSTIEKASILNELNSTSGPSIPAQNVSCRSYQIY